MAGDVVAVAKRALKSSETLDGEGGYTVYGKLVPVGRSLTEGALPIGLAHGVRLTRDVAAGTIVRMSDVALDQGSVALKLRREMAGKTGITSAAQTAQIHLSGKQGQPHAGDEN